MYGSHGELEIPFIPQTLTAKFTFGIDSFNANKSLYTWVNKVRRSGRIHFVGKRKSSVDLYFLI